MDDGGDEVGDKNVLDEEEAADFWDELLAVGLGALVPVPDGGTDGGAGAAILTITPEPDAPLQTVTLHLLGGRIRHFSSKGDFEAVCCSPKPRTCATAKTSKAGADGPHGVMTLGRLWDFMAAWVADHTCSSIRRTK